VEKPAAGRREMRFSFFQGLKQLFALPLLSGMMKVLLSFSFFFSPSDSGEG